MLSRKQNSTPSYKKLSDFQEYAEATERADELKAQQGDLQRTVDELEATIGDGDTDGDTDLRAAAAEMVSGSAAVAIAQPSARVELSDAKQRLAVVTEAGKMQRAAVSAVTKTCQAAMVEERRPGHKKAVQRIEAALTELESAITDERQFRADAARDGCAHNMDHGPALPMISLPGNFGYQRGKSWGMFHAWRQKVALVGYLKFDGRR